MKCINLLVIFKVLLIFYVECSPRSDFEFFGVPFLSETLTATLRRHLSRHRNFRSQFGAPILNARAGRSISESFKNDKPKLETECIYAFESLFCAGIDYNGNEIKVECNASNNFKSNVSETVNKYVLSDLRVLKSKSNKIYKMYMFGQKENSTKWNNYIVRDEMNERNILSIHSKNDGLNDKGITVLDTNCWENILDFFKSIQSSSEISVDNQSDSVSMPIKVIAYLSIF